VALVNQKRGNSAGFLNQELYQQASADFYDITSGNNGAFQAAKGWDACTGLGAPVGSLLESLLAANPNKKSAR
jgi:kumamolisin